MVWLRRIIALPLALVFIVLFVILLVVCRVNATAGDADFYIEQLRRADVYNFLYDEMLPSALEEASSGAAGPGAGMDFTRFEPVIIDFTRQTLPPEWIQTQVENSITEVLPYVLGDTRSFTVRVALQDRVEAGGRAAAGILRSGDTFDSLYDMFIGLVVDGAASSAGGLPEPFALSRGELETMVVTVLPEDWALAQIDGAVTEVMPYFAGREEHFLVTVAVSERLDAMEAVTAGVMARPQTYDYIFENVMAPAVLEDTGGITGTLITGDDIIAVMKEVMPLDWYRAQSGEIVARIFAYLRGEQDTVRIVIPVADRWPLASDAFAGLVDRKLSATWDTLPACSGMQLLRLMADPIANFPPECRPLGMSYAQLKAAVDVVALITPLLGDLLPSEFVLTDADLRRMMAGDGGEDLLAEARELVQQGLTYSDEDLRADMGEDYASLEEIREIIAAGLSFSDEDLHELVVSTGDGAGEADWQQFQAVRASIGAGRSWLWLAWVLPVLLLAGIGALGGRNWRSRVIWAASVLALASALAYITFGPVFAALGRPAVNEAIAGVEIPGGVEGAIAAKVLEIARNSIESFVGGISTMAVILLAAAAVAIVLAALWNRLYGNRAD